MEGRDEFSSTSPLSGVPDSRIHFPDQIEFPFLLIPLFSSERPQVKENKYLAAYSIWEMRQAYKDFVRKSGMKKQPGRHNHNGRMIL
jgi:hypothetical protein